VRFLREISAVDDNTYVLLFSCLGELTPAGTARRNCLCERTDIQLGLLGDLSQF